MKMKVSCRPVEDKKYRFNRETCEYESPKARVFWWEPHDAAEITVEWPEKFKQLKKAVQTILTGFGYKVKLSEIKFSQYAGCSCGCSPGFIVPCKLGKDIFIDITEM